MTLTFPTHLDRIRDGILAQTEILQEVASIYADAIEDGGLVHLYANGHSRITVEETVIRMGALTGFHPILSAGLATFTDVVGPSGIRLNQKYEKVEGLGASLLDEIDFGHKDALVAVSATGTTPAAVDIALEFVRRYPDLPLIAIASLEQSRDAPAKHSSGQNLYHVVQQAKRGYLLDNCMPMGDLAVTIEGQTGTYHVSPLSNIGALTIVQSLNELTMRELDRRGIRHHVLQNMHLANTQDTYDRWIRDQRQRYAKALDHPNPVPPKLS